MTLEYPDLNTGLSAIVVKGEVDLATVDELDNAIGKVLDETKNDLVIDLTGTDFMDSTGLKCLVHASRSFQRSDRQFTLAVKPGPIERLVDLSGVKSTIPVVADLSEVG